MTVQVPHVTGDSSTALPVQTPHPDAVAKALEYDMALVWSSEYEIGDDRESLIEYVIGVH